MNEKKQLISIILPTNHLDLYMEKISTWALDLSPLDWELILVVDESRQDFSLEIARLSERERTVELVFVRGAFGNPGSARNAGIARATGYWVVFWDSDDLPNPLATSRMVTRAQLMEADLAIGSFLVDSKPHLTPSRKSKRMTNLNLITHLTSNPGLWRFCFKAEIVKGIQFPNLRMGEDQVFISLIDLSRIKILISDEVVYEYNTFNPASLTNSMEAISELDVTIEDLAGRILSGRTNKLARYFLFRMYITWLTNSLRSLGTRELIPIARLTIKVLKSLVHNQDTSSSKYWKVTL
jgi:glycosyltransferase involved in cell wall biosynthesis